MKSDLYAYEVKENIVELIFGIDKDGSIADITETYNITEDEILEIAEKIKEKNRR